MQDITLYTSQPKTKFYDELFSNIQFDAKIPTCKTGRKSYDFNAMLNAFIVMKTERFSQITDLVDYLNNNLIIAHYCGFDITKNLPSYWTFQRFLKNIDNDILKEVMQSQVLKLAELGYIDTSFIGLDSTPISANTKHNNPKTFTKNKFKKDSPPKSDRDCKLGVHTASNQHNEKNFEYYWGYKNHILVDCITGLPIFEMTTGANVSDSSVTIDILNQTNEFLSVDECTFLADKGYDTKEIYNTIKEKFKGDCIIPINKRNTKNPKKLPNGNLICDAGLAMNRDGKCKDRGRTRQKFCCPFKRSKNTTCPIGHKNFKQTGKGDGTIPKFV